MLDFDRFVARVEPRVASERSIPILALQFCEPSGTRQRDAIATFGGAVRRIVRAGDACAHQPDSDRCVVAMLAPARSGRPPQAAEARIALARIAAAMSCSTGRLQSGWQELRSADELRMLATTLDAVLERGARERRHSEMLATVGHELRTPLTSIRGYVETLLHNDVDPATSRRFLETVAREALRMGRMVEGMLEFSMLDLSVRNRGDRCNVAQQVVAAIEVVKPLADDRRIVIAAYVPDVAYARIDGDACIRAAINLVDNAVKCAPEGGRVDVTCVRDGEFVCVRVDDNGPGIAPEQREPIFAIGVRGAAARHPGAGIGLALVKRIADNNGGDIMALSSPLGGARFELRIPAE